MAFNFGSENTGFSFGSTTTDAPKTDGGATGGFGGFSFGGTGDSAKTQDKPAPLSFGDQSNTTTATAPTTTGGFGNFSFGDPAPTTTSTETATDTTATSTGGFGNFSFGGGDAGAPTAKTSTTTSTDSGFSFGTTAPTTVTSPQKKEGLSISTPSTGGILKTPTKKKTEEQNKPSVAFKEPSQSKRVESVDAVIKKWNNELNEDVTEFKKYADEVSKWDKELLENEEKVRTYL
jgi:nuclear pore complex protein Nup62